MQEEPFLLLLLLLLPVGGDSTSPTRPDAPSPQGRVSPPEEAPRWNPPW